jgi:hypothetical protein
MEFWEFDRHHFLNHLFVNLNPTLQALNRP